MIQRELSGTGVGRRLAAALAAVLLAAACMTTGGGPTDTAGAAPGVVTGAAPVPGNPIVRELFTADPAALVHDGRIYIFTGRDEASPSEADFVMEEWHAFSAIEPSSDPAVWEHHGPVLSLADFEWADANAWASEVVQGPDGRFYWFVSARWAGASGDGDRMAIGVAVAEDPLGPYQDAIGAPLITARLDSASSHNIDPTVWVGPDAVHLYWGSFWSPRYVRLEESMTELAGDARAVPGLESFWEAPWIFQRDGRFYMLYASNQDLDGDDCVTSRYYACIRYATADHPAGPWSHRGIALGQVSSTTNHPAAVEFPEGSDRWWMIYHTADLPEGGNFRRSVAIDRLEFEVDGTIRRVVQTRAPAPEEVPVASADASLVAAVNCSYTSPWESCEAIASGPEPETSNLPGPNLGTRWATWPEDDPQWIEYRWDHPVRVRAAEVYWFQDTPDEEGGGVKRPAEWSLEYLRDGEWTPVPNAGDYDTALDRYNRTEFRPVTTTALRARVVPREDAEGVGALRWKVYAVEPASIERIEVETTIGIAPSLPERVTVQYPNGETVEARVWWDRVDPSLLQRPGRFTVSGVMEASPVRAEAGVIVRR